jgi:hypothetical protein
MLEIRKIYTFAEESFSEMGQTDGIPLRKVSVAAVLKNPYAGNYQQDLSSLIEDSKEIAQIITRQAVEAMGDYSIESYGKGAVVGIDGEQEHGVALVTTIFGNAFRESIGGGKAWISSVTKRSAPGVNIDIPLAHKDALYVRSHYDGMSLTLHDAPLPDEIVVICTVANRGRINARVGGISKDEVKGEDGLV